MQACETCGNNYDKAFTVKLCDGKEHIFDSFECAIQKLAPRCAACSCRVRGHGVQHEDTIFCSAHCARAQGISGLSDHN
ncbi:MAG: hypothetical protein U5P41_14190 [Gammaproteobacteria bacterium]|nr:hypothetical protein [Gammaproteobacteria bacterium]